MLVSTPYYAVIFTSLRTSSEDGYNDMAQKMIDLAMQQPGFIDVESARNEIGITISYWESLLSISQWKRNAEHLIAQELGKEKWYQWYKVRICKVEHSYDFTQL